MTNLIDREAAKAVFVSVLTGTPEVIPFANLAEGILNSQPTVDAISMDEHNRQMDELRQIADENEHNYELALADVERLEKENANLQVHADYCESKYLVYKDEVKALWEELQEKAK